MKLVLTTETASAAVVLKNQWKKWLDATTHGIKDELRRAGRMR